MNLFKGTPQQLNLYKFSLKGKLMVGVKVIVRYFKQGTNKEKLWEQRKTGQFWKGTRTPLHWETI